MKEQGKYWNPILETLAPEKLQKLQLKKFQNIFRWAYEHSKFYHEIYADAGIEPGDVKTFEDIRKVPKVEKSMMRAIQGKDPYPYGDALCVPLEKVTAYHQTSGTTGQPVYQADMWQDWEWWAESWAYIFYAQGYRDYDRLFLPFGYNVFVAFWAAHYGAEKLGCEVIPGGVLNTEARILKMQELRASAFAPLLDVIVRGLSGSVLPIPTLPEGSKKLPPPCISKERSLSEFPLTRTPLTPSK